MEDVLFRDVLSFSFFQLLLTSYFSMTISMNHHFGLSHISKRVAAFVMYTGAFHL